MRDFLNQNKSRFVSQNTANHNVFGIYPWDKRILFQQASTFSTANHNVFGIYPWDKRILFQQASTFSTSIRWQKRFNSWKTRYRWMPLSQTLNGAKCNLGKVKLETVQSVDSPLPVHDQQGCPRDLAGLAIDSCCSCISHRQKFTVCLPLRICAHAISWVIEGPC